MAANYLIAGIMGSGKSSLVIALLLGAMLDPLVDIDVFVMAYNVDYDAMKPRLRTLIKGDEDEHLEAAMEGLRELVSEVSARGRILEELGGEESKNTRELAENDPRMRARVAVFDEVHELFTHKEFGKEAKELALKVTKKVGLPLLTGHGFMRLDHRDGSVGDGSCVPTRSVGGAAASSAAGFGCTS